MRAKTLKPVRDDVGNENAGSWRLTPHRILRGMWLAVAAPAWVLFILSLLVGIAATAGELRAGLVPVPSWPVVRVAGVFAQSVAALASFVLASVLFLKRPGERMALLLAYFLIANGLVATPLSTLEADRPGLHEFAYSVIQPVLFAPLLIAFLSAFPNGRLVPGWTRWLIIAAILHAPIGTLIFTVERYAELGSIYVLAVVLWFALFLAGLYAQIYRYRYHSSSIERQQTKWVIFGLSLAISFALLNTTITIAYDRLAPEVPDPWWTPVIMLGWSLVYTALPFTLTFAVMRYRLFEIDVLINRTLVYGALTTSVIIVYILIVGGLGVVFQTQGNLIIALFATGMVAVLFQPLRDRLQRGVNRLIYGERDDPFEMLSRLGGQLENALPTEQLLSRLTESIAATLKLPFVGIRLEGAETERYAAHWGDPAGQPLEFPLAFQGEAVGKLLVAPRSLEERFSNGEMRLLRTLARQAGAVVRNAQLTADLLRSRQKLVSAREEERRRLRRDLHDGLGPTLAGLTLKLDAARDLIASGDEHDLAEAERLISELKSQTQSTVQDIRSIVRGLRPPSLELLGLAPALQTHFDQLAGADRLQFDLTIAPQEFPRLSAAIEVAAFRIVLEAVTNVIQHAKAGSCRVSLAVSGDQLRIEVADDGSGYADGFVPGIGLTSMRQRAEELGGRFDIVTSVSGTCVRSEIPLS